MSWNACLVRIQRKDKSESFLVTADKFTIGRSPECDFVIADSQVSRKHLGVLVRSGQIFIKDLHSANGTKMGATKVPVENVMLHQNGEAIRLGTAELTVYLEYIEKKIDLKNLAETSAPEDVKKDYQHHLETSKNRNKQLFDEYEGLVKGFKEFTKSETEKFQSENSKILRESEEKIKTTTEANELHILQLKQVAEIEIKKRIESAEAESQAIVSNAESKATSSIESAEQKSRALLTEAEEKAKITLTSADSTAAETIAAAEKKAIHIISAGEQKLQDLISRLDEEEKRLLAETKHKNEDLAAQIQEDATKKAQEITALANSKAKSILHDSEIESELLIKTARSKIAASQNEVEVQNKNRITESILKAEKIVSDALQKAKDAIDEAQLQARETLEAAEYKASQLNLASEATAKKLIQEVQVQVDLQYEKFEDHKKTEIARLKTENESFKAQIQTASQKEQDRYKEAFELKVRLFEDECSIRRKNLERDLSGQMQRLDELKAEERQFLDRINKLVENTKSKESEHENQLAALMDLVAKHSQQQKVYETKNQEINALTKEKSDLQTSLEELVRSRESENAKIQTLKQQIKQERQNLDTELQAGRGRIDDELSKLRDKELKDIDRLRVDALAQIEALKTKAIEEIVHNKSMFMINLSERIQGLFVALHKKSTDELNLPALKTEVFNMIQGAVEEQSFELTQKHEGDIRHLVKQETQKRKLTAQKSAMGLLAIAASAIGFYIYQGGNIENIMLGRNSSGESAAEEFGRQQREQRDSKKFEPPQSDFIKSSYTDNVLYTRNYYSVFTSPQMQEQWITLLNGIFSKDFNLEDDAIVKFVAAESTLVTKLQQEKDQVVPDFAQIGIDKMRKVEKESTEQMKAILKDPAYIRKFQSISEKFWHEKLQERLPASK